MTLFAIALFSIAPAALADDIIVIEEVAQPSGPINTAPLDSLKELSGTQRSLLSRAISLGCTRKAGAIPEIAEISQRTGRDAGKTYCACMSDYMAENLSVSMLKTVASTRALPPEMQAGARAHAQQCIQLANQQ
jgi:hypothetical protein